MVMNDNFFLYLLRNKIAIFLVIFILSFVGYIVSESIPQGVFPNVFFPRIEVNIDLGFTPIRQMLFQVTKPAEESLKTIQGVEKIVSSTSVGNSDINMNFNWRMDPYLAYQLVNARVAEIKNQIPPDAKITVIQATPSRFPISMYYIASNKVPRHKLTEILIYTLRPVLLGVKGIQDIVIKAPDREEIKIVLNLEKMQSYKLEVSTVTKILEELNFIDFLGLINDCQKQYILSLNQKPDSLDDILKVRIPIGDNAWITLSDIATVVHDHAPLSQISAGNDAPLGVVFEILRQPDANSIDVAREVDKKISEVNENLKEKDVWIKKSYDETEFITDAVKSVKDAIFLGTIIASFIVLLFLRKVKLSVFLVLVVPIVFLISIIGIRIGNYDFNIFSLGGMAAAIGGLIDHIIIVIENIERHYRKTRDKLKAVVDGSREILPLMTIATLISVLVFLPLLLVSGVVGVFFKQLAFVLISTYVISQLLAMIFTPIIAYISLPSVPEEEEEGLFEWFVGKYTRFLGFFLRGFWISAPLIFVVTIGGLYGCYKFYEKLPTTFLPKWDEGNFVVDITLPPGTSLAETYKEFSEVGKIVNSLPEVRSWTLRIGTALGHTTVQPNVGDMLVVLKKDRKRSIDEIQDELRTKIGSKFPHFEALDLPQMLEDRLNDILGEEAPIAVILYGTDPDQLIQWGKTVRDALRKVEGLEEVNLQTNYTSPAIDVKLKPEAEVLYGVDVEALFTQINTLYFGKITGYLMNGEKIINVRLLLESPSTDPIRYLEDHLLVFSPKQQQHIPLRYLADVKFSDQVPEINHYNLSSVAITSVRFHGNDMLEAVHKVEQTIASLKIPKEITPEISGIYRDQQQSFREMGIVVLLSILIIFTALLFQFGSIRIAITTLLGLILTLVGVFAALYFTKKPLDITAFMGMLIVLSIVINNNILIFDYYKEFLWQGGNKLEAILHSISNRFRPIFMTMLSNIFALLPVALGWGSGTQIIQNMAIAIMGGLSFAIFINLFVIPQMLMISAKFD
ncbi:MAG: efflux RND transporter permease subunit [Candidatus Riflebacteria bacterium]|nr:efflux RND transporter permease subunit [Candidatus Riflebacteria bacterium]